MSEKNSFNQREWGKNVRDGHAEEMRRLQNGEIPRERAIVPVVPNNSPETSEHAEWIDKVPRDLGPELHEPQSKIPAEIRPGEGHRAAETLGKLMVMHGTMDAEAQHDFIQGTADEKYDVAETVTPEAAARHQARKAEREANPDASFDKLFADVDAHKKELEAQAAAEAEPTEVAAEQVAAQEAEAPSDPNLDAIAEVDPEKLREELDNKGDK